MITLLDIPTLFTPVYNTHPLYISLSSDKSYEEAFNFIFDLYVNDVFVNRVNLLPRPGTNEVLYSPARILESYLSYDRFSYTIQGDSNNVNDVVEWRVECGEEYVFYWPFFDTQINILDTLTRLVNNTGVKHPFVLGDKIIVDSPLYPYFSGIHTIVEIVDEYIVVINKAFITTPLNPGTAVIQTKIKTEFFYTELVFNPSIIDTEGGYSLYGPDAGGNSSYLINASPSVPSNLFIYELLDSTIIPNNTIDSIVTTNEPISGGRYYKVEFDVQRNFPFDAYDQHYVQVIIGGIAGKKHYDIIFTTRTFTEIIQCGYADTEVRIVFGLEGADTSLGANYYIAMSRFTINQSPLGYSFNGVIQYNEASIDVWEYLWDQYKMNIGLAGGVGKFLTNQPQTVKTRINDLGSIGWINYANQETTPNRRFYMVIGSYQADGTVNTAVPIEIFNMLPSNPTNPQNRIVEFGIYPQNLNAWGQSYLGVNLIDDFCSFYIAQLYLVEDVIADPFNFQAVSEYKVFEIDRSCSKYEPVRFMFLNSLGQFDYYNATLLSRTTISGTRDTFVKTLGYNYEIGDRGKTVINVNSQESYIIHTDWISEETANWLSYDFFNSTEMYVIDNITEQLIPIILDTTSIEVKKRVNDKLLNYTFNYSKAVPLNNQRN